MTNSKENQNSLIDLFGPVISRYTRAQAIEDGFLVDVSSTAKEAGLKFPVALTTQMYEDINNIPVSKSYQSFEGRLWDVLTMLVFNIKRGNSGSIIKYDIIMHKGSRTYYSIIAECGPGDNMEPVITLKPGQLINRK